MRDDDLSRRIWRRKHDDWDRLDLWLVPLSEWLADCARRSDIFRHTPVKVIPNGIDCDRFRPGPRAETRARIGLDRDKCYLLFGAIGALHDRRKGFPELLEAIRNLPRHITTDNVELVVFGDLAPESVPDTGIATRFLGHIDDDERLAALYTAADVMITPSLQEAFGKTLIEAMACGTPVVAFDSGGPGEIVLHKETGYLARPFDPDDLARGIAWCLGNDVQALGGAARKRVENEYRTGIVARRYLDHYREILGRAHGTGPRRSARSPQQKSAVGM